ncbi:MAG: hypothetical protein Q8K82_12840 [Gemmatimonadaceae bacterium]|nr:hypothetical protein [Gemmatimonadaceae bacterium]
MGVTDSVRTSFLVFAVLCGACTSGEQGDPPREPAVVPDVPQWRLSAHGFGPLVAGMTAADAARATRGTLSLPAVTSSEQCAYASWGAAPAGIKIMFEGGVLVRVDVTAPGVATAEGLEVGSPAARADSLYGAGATRRPHKYEDGEYLIVQPLAPADTMQRLVIELVGGTVKRFRVGRIPQVEYVEGCS